MSLSLFRDLQSRGFRFSVVEGGGLLVSPSKELTKEEQDLIRSHKPDLLALLDAQYARTLPIREDLSTATGLLFEIERRGASFKIENGELRLSNLSGLPDVVFDALLNASAELVRDIRRLLTARGLPTQSKLIQ